MIQACASIEISQSTEEVSGFIDDFSPIPTWLESSAGLQQVSPESRGAGTRLRYTYRQGRRTGHMDGAIVSFEPNRRLEMRFEDYLFQVEVSLRLTGGHVSTQIEHSIIIKPKATFGKLLAPIIGFGNRKQVAQNLVRLERNIESRTS